MWYQCCSKQIQECELQRNLWLPESRGFVVGPEKNFNLCYRDKFRSNVQADWQWG